MQAVPKILDTLQPPTAVEQAQPHLHGYARATTHGGSSRQRPQPRQRQFLTLSQYYELRQDEARVYMEIARLYGTHGRFHDAATSWKQALRVFVQASALMGVDRALIATSPLMTFEKDPTHPHGAAATRTSASSASSSSSSSSRSKMYFQVFQVESLWLLHGTLTCLTQLGYAYAKVGAPTKYV